MPKFRASQAAAAGTARSDPGCDRLALTAERRLVEATAPCQPARKVRRCSKDRQASGLGLTAFAPGQRPVLGADELGALRDEQDAAGAEGTRGASAGHGRIAAKLRLAAGIEQRVTIFHDA